MKKGGGDELCDVVVVCDFEWFGVEIGEDYFYFVVIVVVDCVGCVEVGDIVF